MSNIVTYSQLTKLKRPILNQADNRLSLFLNLRSCSFSCSSNQTQLYPLHRASGPKIHLPNIYSTSVRLEYYVYCFVVGDHFGYFSWLLVCLGLFYILVLIWCCWGPKKLNCCWMWWYFGNILKSYVVLVCLL